MSEKENTNRYSSARKSLWLWFTFIILWAFVKPSNLVQIRELRLTVFTPKCAWTGLCLFVCLFLWWRGRRCYSWRMGGSLEMWPVHTDMMSLSLKGGWGGGGEKGSLKLKRLNLVMQDAFLKFSIWSLSYSRVFFFYLFLFFGGVGVGEMGGLFCRLMTPWLTEHLFCRAQLMALLLSLFHVNSRWIENKQK